MKVLMTLFFLFRLSLIALIHYCVEETEEAEGIPADFVIYRSSGGQYPHLSFSPSGRDPVDVDWLAVAKSRWQGCRSLEGSSGTLCSLPGSRNAPDEQTLV